MTKNTKLEAPPPCSGWKIFRRDFLKLAAGCWPASRLAAAAPPSLRFGILTDLHYAERPPANGRHYRHSLTKLRGCISLMQSERVDFLAELGDFKDQNDPPDEASTLEYLRSIETLFRTFRGARYHVLGNHDLDSISKQQFRSLAVSTEIDRSRTWYSFDRQGWHFAVLDANFRADGEPYDHGNFEWQDCNIPDEQLEWLATDLAAATGPAIIFVHQRLDGDGDTTVRNAPAVRQVLEDSGKVALVLQGHDHPGAYQQIGQVHYYTLVAAVESNDPRDNTCATVELQPNGRVRIKGYRRAQTKRL